MLFAFCLTLSDNSSGTCPSNCKHSHCGESQPKIWLEGAEGRVAELFDDVVGARHAVQAVVEGVRLHRLLRYAILQGCVLLTEVTVESLECQEICLALV